VEIGGKIVSRDGSRNSSKGRGVILMYPSDIHT
jgi:hypothetical protein